MRALRSLGKEFGDEMGDLNMDEMEQAIEEEMGSSKKPEGEGGRTKD